MAAAVIFSAVSCAKEDISSTIGGGEVEVTFTADLGQLGTRAYGEADNVDVVYLGVYEANTNVPLSSLVSADGYPVTDGKASITVVLLKDKKYDLVFWAQNKAQTCYNVVWNERKVTVNYDGVKSQNDARDAFFLVENDFHAGHDETIFKLYRPFAQLNAGLNATDVDYVAQNGVDISKFKSQVVVKQVASTLNLLEEATDTALDVADFVDVTYALEAKPTQKLNVSGTDYEYLSMNYLLVDAKQNVDVTYTFVDGEGTEYLRPYYQVPVQRNYRTNILGQLISSPLDFNVIIVPDFNTPDSDLQGDTQTFNVSSQAEFEDALAKAAGQDHIQHLVINLNADVALDVAAWQTLAIGNKNTKDITINGSKSRAANDDYYTLTFNNTNSDWNNIVTNGAKLILESLNITNSGHDATSGTWNAHDIVFACEVEMNNVVSLNAIAVEADATFNNTTIYDDNTSTSGSYALWIPTNGQTVTLNKCLIDSTGADNGRGIKIDEQYVDAPEKVILNVSDTKFVTEKKAAILVKSVAGAEVNASNLDIAGVAADSVYAVWVDEASAAYYDLVEVSGAKVRLEGSTVISNKTGIQDALNTALNAGNSNVTIDAGGANIGDLSYGLSSSKIPAGTTLTIYNANVEGSSYGNGVNGTVIFENCTFNNPNGAYSIHFDSGNGDVKFKNCTLYGWNSFGSSLNSVSFEGCSLYGNGKYALIRSYVDLTLKDCLINTSDADATDVYSEGVEAVNGATLTEINVIYEVNDNSALKVAIEAGHTEIYLKNSGTDYDLNGIQKDGLTLIGNGDGVEIANTTKYASGKATGAIWKAINLKNMTITNTVYTMADGSDATFEDVTFAAGFRQGYGKGVVFTNCTFGSNSEGYALHFQTDSASEGGEIKLAGCKFNGGKVHLGGKRAYAFSGCEFAAGTDFQVWSNISLENCTVDGVAVTASNMATLFPNLNAEKVTIK